MHNTAGFRYFQSRQIYGRESGSSNLDGAFPITEEIDTFLELECMLSKLPLHKNQEHGLHVLINERS
jgi:hypothetical protein